MDSDEDDFVFFGTPIEREEDMTTRKKKAIAEASGQLRTLPAWKQEVRDEEGRRRFHGAFTGGFSAGYYNSVGSKEGWTPQSFTSSRKNRAEIKQQSVFSFLDDDEKAELEGNSLGTSAQFDTFGFTAAEVTRKQAEKEQQKRPSAIPGPVPDELVLPASDSIGVKLLLKMGWRRGRSIKDLHANTLFDARREARRAFLAFSYDDTSGELASSELAEADADNAVELPVDDDTQFSKSTPVYVLNPKQDLYGLGYDPFKHAPEFREKKRSRLSGNSELGHKKPLSMKDSLFGFKLERTAPGFGIGALEDLDAEDEDIYGADYGLEDTYVQEVEEPSRMAIENRKKFDGKKQGVLPGFKAASNSDYQLERFDPPVIPKDFLPYHKFSSPLMVEFKLADTPPREVAPPDNNDKKVLIEGMASLVARCGKLFEDLSKEKNESNPSFSFLNGGDGHDYYIRKLWEKRQKHDTQLAGGMIPRMQKMTAESRGKILGEKPLERSSKDLSAPVISADAVNIQFNLTDTFTMPVPYNEVHEAAKPFQDDPTKQERFEQFLKEKYQGGLRSKDAGGASQMSEAARARERLEFEAAADTIQKRKQGKESRPSDLQLMGISVNTGLQFTSSGIEQGKVGQPEELITKKLYPRREEFQWRPSPILCKRFDLIDPYMGKPLPAQRARSKMDSLIFMPDLVKSTKLEPIAVDKDFVSVSQSGEEEKTKQVADGEVVEVEVENVERPVDLFKAIFSDDSDDEDQNSNQNIVENPQKKIEAANATLNRLIAGDFLESLGKELGLEVPPDVTYSENKTRTPATQKASAIAGKGGKFSSVNPVSGLEEPQGKLHQEFIPEGGTDKQGGINSDTHRSGMKIVETGSLENNSAVMMSEKDTKDNRKAKVHMGHNRNQSSSDSEDERSRKRSRHHRRRQRGSDTDATDSPDDSWDRNQSRSKGRKKESSWEKSSSRRHSKHHNHRRYSPGNSSRHGSRREKEK